MRDQVHNVAIVQAIAPAVQSGTVESGEIDMTGFESLTVIVETGAIVGAGDFTAALQYEDDSTSPQEWTAVPAADLLGSFPASLSASSVVAVGLKRAYSNLRVALTKNGGTSIAASVSILKGHPHEAPVA